MGCVVEYLYIYILTGAVIAFSGYLFYCFKVGGKEKTLIQFKKTIHGLIITAEKTIAKKKTEEKMEWVVNTVINLFPKWCSEFIDKDATVAQVKEFCQNVYDDLLDWSKNGCENGEGE